MKAVLWLSSGIALSTDYSALASFCAALLKLHHHLLDNTGAGTSDTNKIT